MATANELLGRSAGATEKVCAIDFDTQTINIPKSITVLGVESDDNVKKLHFRMPKTYHGSDLSKFSIRINYMNANNDPAYFAPAKGVTVDEVNDTITFYWDIERDVVAYKGNVKFIVCAKRTDTDGKILQELNTTPTMLPVLEGLETDMENIQVEPKDYLAQLLSVKDDYIEDLGTAYTEHEANLNAAYEAHDENLRNTAEVLAKTVGEPYRSRANAIVNTAEGSVISVNDASDDYLRGLRVFGKSTQEPDPSPDNPRPIVSIENSTVNIYGKNLLNTVNTTKSANGVTFMVNPDKSVTINGTSWAATFFNIDMDSEINYQGAELIASLDGNTSAAYLNIGYFTEDAKFVDTLVTVGITAKTFVYPDEAVKSRVYMFVNSGTTFNNVTVRPMIRLATNENGVYEPYIEPQTLAISHTLSGIPVTTGGNYTDEHGQQWICDEIDFERKKYIQRIGRFELDGGAKWVEYASDPTPNLSYRGFMIWNMLDETCSRPNGFCNQFQTVGAGTDNCVWVGANGDYCVYVVSKEWHNKGIDAWKAHLNENPLEVIYTRVAPIYHDLSESELAAYSAPHSNYPTTTVTNNQGAHMELKYNADTKIAYRPLRVLFYYHHGTTDDTGMDIGAGFHTTTPMSKVRDAILSGRPVVGIFDRPDLGVLGFTAIPFLCNGPEYGDTDSAEEIRFRCPMGIELAHGIGQPGFMSADGVWYLVREY